MASVFLQARQRCLRAPTVKELYHGASLPGRRLSSAETNRMSFKLYIALVATALLGLCRETASADVFRLLVSNYEAAQARVDVMDQATVSIDTSYYWIGNDRIGAMFLSRLQAAALRGVRVRLVVDAEHNDVPAEVLERLVRSGVAIKEFHPVSCRHPRWINLRMHDKTLIVDGEQLIVGSRNIRNAHFGLEETNFVDRDAYLRGEIAQQAQRYFDCLWNCAEVEPVRLKDGPWQELHQKDKLELCQLGISTAGPHSPCEQACLWLAAGAGLTICCQPVLTETGNDWSAACTTAVARVCFVYDPCGRKGHPRGISRQLTELIRCAHSCILLETPYFLMSHELKTALAEAMGRGVHVQLLTNSLASSDHTLVAAAFTNQKHHFLLPRGVDVWELAGPDHLHAKTAVIDGATAFIGSYNFDPRSEYLNTETGVVIADPKIAAQVEASIRSHMRQANHVLRDGRDQASGRRHPGASMREVLRMKALQPVAPLIRRSL
jgi:phosphatidylserine/phosphatidylglycerophosphate/cardiolipin synthase-like enzyme